MKNIAFLGGVLVVLVIIIILVSSSNKPKTTTTTSNTNEISYFDENARVMYFWQESCHYCQLQKPILQELSDKYGLKVKSMDVGAKPELWKEYNIEGTPTFIAPDGQKLVGYQEDKEKLKEFLEKYK